MRGKKFGCIAEGFQCATSGVKSVMDNVVKQLRSAGAIVEVVSIPQHEKGTNPCELQL